VCLLKYNFPSYVCFSGNFQGEWWVNHFPWFSFSNCSGKERSRANGTGFYGLSVLPVKALTENWKSDKHDFTSRLQTEGLLANDSELVQLLCDMWAFFIVHDLNYPAIVSCTEWVISVAISRAFGTISMLIQWKAELLGMYFFWVRQWHIWNFLQEASLTPC